jgi:hypothetical protein
MNVESLLVDERGVAVDSETGATFRLIGPALPLMRLLQQGATEEQMLEYLLHDYDVDKDTAQRDLEIFLHALEKLNLWKRLA